MPASLHFTKYPPKCNPTHLIAAFQDNLRKPVPKRLNQSGFKWGKRWWSFGMQWHQLDHMQTICTSLQTDNHTNTSSLNFYRLDALPDAQPTVSEHWRHMHFPTNSGETTAAISQHTSRQKTKQCMHKVYWHHRIYGHNTNAILWV